MNSGNDLDFESLIQRGEPIGAQIVPLRQNERHLQYKEKKRARHKSIFYDRERAEVCLNCPLPNCDGSQRCYKRMKQDKAYAIRVYTKQIPKHLRTSDSVCERMNIGESIETFLRVLNAMLSRIENL